MLYRIKIIEAKAKFKRCELLLNFLRNSRDEQDVQLMFRLPSPAYVWYAVRLWTFHCSRYPEILYLHLTYCFFCQGAITLLLPGFKLIDITMLENSARRVPNTKTVHFFSRKTLQAFLRVIRFTLPHELNYTIHCRIMLVKIYRCARCNKMGNRTSPVAWQACCKARITVTDRANL